MRSINDIINTIESVAYSSQGTIPVNYASVTDWQMAVRWNNAISKCSFKSINVDFLNQIRYFTIK